MDAVREREARFPDKRIAAMANNDGYTPGIQQCQQHRHRLAHRRPSLHPLCTSRYFPRLGEGRKGGGIPQQGSWNSDLAGRNPLSLPQ